MQCIKALAAKPESHPQYPRGRKRELTPQQLSSDCCIHPVEHVRGLPSLGGGEGLETYCGSPRRSRRLRSGL